MAPLLLLFCAAVGSGDGGLGVAPDAGSVAMADGGASSASDAGPPPAELPEDAGDAGAAEPAAPGDGGYAPSSYGEVATPGFEMRFSGNKVLPEEVYRAVLDFPPDTAANEATATVIREKLETFLHRSGYELGTVNTAIEGTHLIAVDVNEGLLEKVVFRGKFTYQTLRFKLALQLPFDIFNRPELDRQIKSLRALLGMGRVWYKLIPTRVVKHLGPQLDNLGDIGEIQGHELVHPREPYELHVFFEEHEWDNGAWMDIRTSNQDGLEFIGTFQKSSLLLNDDREHISVSGGAGLRKYITTGNYYPTFTRAYGEFIYYLPVPVVKPLFEARSELLSRQRADLFLENYYNLYVDALISGQYEFAKKQTITFGFGERYQRLFDLSLAYSDIGPNPVFAPDGCDTNEVVQQTQAATSTQPAQFSYTVPFCLSTFRTFAELRVNLLFDDGNERADRSHSLTIEARDFFDGPTKNFGESRLAWQRVFAFGWHDLWLKAHGALLWGGVPFHNEEAVDGTHLRNVFGEIYVHKVASESTEFRFSITRDVFKVSLFNDISTFGYIPNQSHISEVPAFGDCFGAGFHALIEGMFQMDLYYAVGFTTADVVQSNQPPSLGPAGNPLTNTIKGVKWDNGFSASLQKVF